MSDLTDLLARRRSVRAYTNDPVQRATLDRICLAARRAPSGANLQPGRFHILKGAPLDALKTRLMSAQENAEPIDLEYSYFPKVMAPELKDRQRSAGFALYKALGIERRDTQARRDQFAKNYAFFDAPIGIVVTIERTMGKGCFMDLGMSIMAFLLAAQDEGLGTTGIGAIANYGRIAHQHLELPENEMIVCGIALGVPDMSAKVNGFRTDRQPLPEFTTFRGFDEDP